MKSVVLYSRPGCRLCDQLEEDLEEQFSGRILLERRCVDDRDEWKQRYGLQVPVLADAQGAVLCRVVLDSARVRDYLAD